MKHPGSYNLALLAGGEAGAFHRFRLERHVRNCEECQEKVAEFRDLRSHLADVEMPDLNWNFLAREMSANIRVGLEAGACVGDVRAEKSRWPQLAMAFASLLFVVGAGVFFTQGQLHRTGSADLSTPVLQPTRSGIELRRGLASFAFMDREGGRTDRTVSAQGAIEARSINDDTGSVTITNVLLQQ
jgi:hypothetical protein